MKDLEHVVYKNGVATNPDKVKVINDFEAIGYGIESLDEKKDLVTIQKGKRDEGTSHRDNVETDRDEEEGRPCKDGRTREA